MKIKFKLKFVHSKSIYIQLVIYSLVISLVPILIISSFLFRKLENMVVDELIEYHGQITSEYYQNLEEKLEQYRKSLEFISKNTIIRNTLIDQEQNPYSKGSIISEEVDKSLLLEQDREIRNCMVYSMIEDAPVYGRSVSMMKEASREVWYLKDRAMDETWFSYFALENKKPVLSLVNNIELLDVQNLKKRQLGIVKLDVDIQRLFSPAPLEGASEAAYDVIVYDDNAIFYSTMDECGEILKKYQEEPDTDGDAMQEVDTYVVRHRDLNNYGLKFLILFDNGEVLKRKQETQLMVFPLILVMVSVALLCAYLYSKSFSARIENLVKKFKVAETGDLTISEPIGGNDEIAVLDHQFNHMLMKLDALIKKNYIQQLENKETQLRNLQLQINPHFLYNTLETISSIAAVKQAFVVCDMCQKLGEIFRYSLGKNYGEFVTLQQELDHTNNYIFIQKIRQGNRFEVFYDIEVDGGKYRILRFVLQPIVENAIQHGLGNLTGKGTLEISACVREEMLLIKIVDDGIGMDRQKVEELQAYINSTEKEKDSAKSIGIRNVNQRIKLSCGEEYGVTIDSYPYQGSCFTLRLPVIRGGEEDEA